MGAREPDAAQELPESFAQFIDPVLRLKLELAGFTIADAEALGLEAADHVERSTTERRAGSVKETFESERSAVRTVASLPPEQQRAVARSIGLQGIASSSLSIDWAATGLRFTLEWELRTVPENDRVLRVRCAESYEFPQETASLLANCVGDGVLAVRAPDALLGRSL